MTLADVPTGFDPAIYEQMAAELERSGPPDGFPVLPDIPLGRYTDPAFHELERREVFGRTWLFAGSEAEYPEAGSYRAVDIPLAPIIAVRGDDGRLRAFLNACRHRGAPVVREAAGCARRLTCQFHSWSYDLEGRLARVPEERDFVGLDKAERSLTPVRLETWGGLVFVNLDPDAGPLLDAIDPVVRRFDHLLTKPLRHVDTKQFHVRSNWKVVLEAFLEVYHLKTVHKDTAAQFGRSTGAVIGMHPGGHSTMFFPYTSDVIDGGEESMAHQVMFPSDLPTPEDAHPIYGSTNVLFALFPNLSSPVSPQGFPVVQAWPLAIDETRFDVRWYGLDWGEGPRPAGWDLKFMAWDLVLSEDLQNLEPIQRSIESAAHGGIPLGYQERAIWHLHASLDRQIGPDRIPEALRVPDLLSHLVEP